MQCQNIASETAWDLLRKRPHLEAFKGSSKELYSSLSTKETLYKLDDEVLLQALQKRLPRFFEEQKTEALQKILDMMPTSRAYSCQEVTEQLFLALLDTYEANPELQGHYETARFLVQKAAELADVEEYKSDTLPWEKLEKSLMAEKNASTPESESSTAAVWVESAGFTVEGLTKALLCTKAMGYLVSCLVPPAYSNPPDVLRFLHSLQQTWEEFALFLGYSKEMVAEIPIVAAHLKIPDLQVFSRLFRIPDTGSAPADTLLKVYEAAVGCKRSLIAGCKLSSNTKEQKESSEVRLLYQLSLERQSYVQQLLKGKILLYLSDVPKNDILCTSLLSAAKNIADDLRVAGDKKDFDQDELKAEKMPKELKKTLGDGLDTLKVEKKLKELNERLGALKSARKREIIEWCRDDEEHRMRLLQDEWVSEHVKAVQELKEDTGDPGNTDYTRWREETVAERPTTSCTARLAFISVGHHYHFRVTFKETADKPPGSSSGREGSAPTRSSAGVPHNRQLGSRPGHEDQVSSGDESLPEDSGGRPTHSKPKQREKHDDDYQIGVAVDNIRHSSIAAWTVCRSRAQHMQEVETILCTTCGFPRGYVINWYEGSFQASQHQDGPKAAIRIQQFDDNKRVTLLPGFQPILKRMIDEESHPTMKTVCLLRPHPKSFTPSTEVELRFNVEGVTTKAGGVPCASFIISPPAPVETQSGQDPQCGGVPSALFRISPLNRTQSGQDPQDSYLPPTQVEEVADIIEGGKRGSVTWIELGRQLSIRAKILECIEEVQPFGSTAGCCGTMLHVWKHNSNSGGSIMELITALINIDRFEIVCDLLHFFST